MHFSNQIKKYFPFLALALFLYGCGVWGDFTTYFNLYYNTKHLFNEAESSIEKDRVDLFVRVEPQINPGDNQKLQKVIEKCSKILQFSGDSRYVDDALMILGKSFYYQQNYLKASREFEELLQTQPDSDLRLEARLWLGKSQLRLNKVETALATLKNVRDEAVQQEENEILEQALIEEIKYKVSSDDIAGAVKSSEDFLNISDNDELNQKIAFELGTLEVNLKNYDEAVNAYQKVLNYSPSYDMEFNAKMALGKAYMLGGKSDKAYALFDDMSSLDKNFDVLDKIDLQKGLSLVELSRYNEALDVLTEVDTAYKSTPAGGAARFEIGRIYENIFNQFDSASAYYQKASISVVPREYLNDVRNKVAKFRKYANLKTGIAHDQKQFEYSQNPELYLEDSTKYYDNLKKIKEELAKNSSENQGNNFSSGRERDLGNNIKNNITRANLSKPPERPVISSDSIKAKINYAEYELGNLFFTELDWPDSAFYYYSKVLKENPSRNLEANTMYVVGNYYLAKGDSASADSIFNVIYNKFKDNSLVNSVATILNKPLVNFDYDPAQELYSNAEKLLLSKEFYKSLDQFRNIYVNYPNSPRAPKAIYASGWVYENELMNPDSAAAFYDSLKVKYPRSEYALNIDRKLNIYNTEKIKIRKAHEDSLKTTEQKSKITEAADSTRVDRKAIPIDQLKRLPPGLRFEARGDSARKLPDSNVRPEIKRGGLSPIRKPGSAGDSLMNKFNKVKRDSLPQR